MEFNRSGSDRANGLTVDEMTAADIAKAQELARECMSSNYENCGY